MKLGTKLGIAVPASYAIAVGIATAVVSCDRSDTEKEVARLAHLGDDAGEELRAMPLDLPPLASACEGLLDPGEPAQLVAYAAPYSVELDDVEEPDVAQPHVFLPRRRFQGMGTHGLDGERADEQPYRSLVDVYRDVALSAPWMWGKTIERHGRRSLRFDDVRYLVVSVVREFDPPKIIDKKTFMGGHGKLLARVVDAHDGATLCEGSVAADIAPTVVASAKASGDHAVDVIMLDRIEAPRAIERACHEALQLSALEAVCGAGGDTTCEAVRRTLEPEKARNPLRF